MQTPRGKGKIKRSNRSDTQWLTRGTKTGVGHLYDHERPLVAKARYRTYHKGRNG